MCWCFPFGISSNKKRKSTSSGDKKRREKPAAEQPLLHGQGVAVVAEVHEKRRSRETPQKKKPREAASTRSPRREREEHRPRYEYQAQDARRSRDQYRPALNVEVPNMWHRTVDPESVNSSQEMLLNPRPHRSPHHRQRHPKRTSQSTLRGRGAKRDPPRSSKSKRNLRQETPRQGWSFFSPSPPKTPSRRGDRHYTTLESSPRSHRSSRTHSTQHYQDVPESSQSQQRSHRSRQHTRQPPSTRQARSRTPNTAARRTPDRRFAVLAATNQALEDLRREAFAQPSPPPRRERLQRYQGVTVPTSQIPFNWDCVSSSQTSASYGESSTRHRRRAR